MQERKVNTTIKEYIFKHNEFLQKLGITDIHGNFRVQVEDDYTVTVSAQETDTRNEFR